MSEVSIVHLSSTDSLTLGEIARLHVRAFRNLLSGDLGEKFLRFFYRRLSSDPWSVVLCCWEGNILMGYVSGTVSTGNFYDTEMIVRTVLAILGNCLRNPSSLINVLRNMKKKYVLRKSGMGTELLTWVVAENARGKGIGTKLFLALEDFFRSKDVREFRIITDLKYSNSCYLLDKLGVKVEKEMHLFGLPVRVYLRSL